MGTANQNEVIGFVGADRIIIETELTVEGKVPECYAPTRTRLQQSTVPAALFNSCCPIAACGQVSKASPRQPVCRYHHY